MAVINVPETHGESSYNLPYRIMYSPQTGEVFVMTTNLNVIMAFLNVEAAERFSDELQKTILTTKPKILQTAESILRRYSTNNGD